MFLSEAEDSRHLSADDSQANPDDPMTASGSGNLHMDTKRGSSYVPVRLGANVIGGIRIEGKLLSKETLEAVGTLSAIAVERARAIEYVSRMEASRESDRLKAALMDAIEHDFRSPLTSIKVSVSGMLTD